MFALPRDFHTRVRLLKILNHLARCAVQSISIVGITLGLRHANNQPVGEAAMAAAVIDEPGLRSKRDAATFSVGILFPVIRILERVRIRLIFPEVARWWRRGSDAAGKSRVRVFHHLPRQHIALDSFGLRGVPTRD